MATKTGDKNLSHTMPNVMKKSGVNNKDCTSFSSFMRTAFVKSLGIG